MHRQTVPFAAAAALGLWLATTAATCAQQAMPGMAAPANPADQAMQAGMLAMQRDMAAAPTSGDPDRDFVAMMLPHHQGAVDMAKAELRFGKDPALRRLAASIVADQEREIDEMRAWQHTHP